MTKRNSQRKGAEALSTRFTMRSSLDEKVRVLRLAKVAGVGETATRREVERLGLLALEEQERKGTLHIPG